jgi:hypothetical protein
MISGRFFTPLLFLLLMCIFPPESVFAFWGFGEKEGKSGLNFEQGYDLNTVTTIRGKVVSIDAGDGNGPVTIAVHQGLENVHIIAAPRWFWSDRGIPIKVNNEVVVTGAKAQGKDGIMYVISSKISNLSTGESVTVRSEAGMPLWKGGGRMERGGGGMQRHHGGGMRGR